VSLEMGSQNGEGSRFEMGGVTRLLVRKAGVRLGA